MIPVIKHTDSKEMTVLVSGYGKKNQPIRVEYRGYAGVDQIRKGVYDVMDAAQYGDYIRMSYENNGLGDKVPADTETDGKQKAAGE